MKPIKIWLVWYISAMLLLVQYNTAENVVEDTASTNDPNYKIIDYVAGWRSNFQQQRIAAEKLTRISYAFAHITNGKVVEGSELHYFPIVSPDEMQPQITLILCTLLYQQFHKSLKLNPSRPAGWLPSISCVALPFL